MFDRAPRGCRVRGAMGGRPRASNPYPTKRGSQPCPPSPPLGPFTRVVGQEDSQGSIYPHSSSPPSTLSHLSAASESRSGVLTRPPWGAAPTLLAPRLGGSGGGVPYVSSAGGERVFCPRPWVCWPGPREGRHLPRVRLRGDVKTKTEAQGANNGVASGLYRQVGQRVV